MRNETSSTEFTPTDGIERAGGSVQTFDRDLPGWEGRAVAAPQMFGDTWST